MPWPYSLGVLPVHVPARDDKPGAPEYGREGAVAVAVPIAELHLPCADTLFATLGAHGDPFETPEHGRGGHRQQDGARGGAAAQRAPAALKPCVETYS